MKSVILVAVLLGIVLQAVNTSRILQTRCVTLNISVTGGGGGGGEGGEGGEGGGGQNRRLQVLCDNFEYVASGNNSCIRDEFCPASQFCLNASCRQKQCISDGDCYSNTDGLRVCRNYLCVHRPCQSNSTCGLGYYCNNKSCTLIRCQNDSQCRLGEFCNMYSQTCAFRGVQTSPTVPSGLRNCTGDGQCLLGQFCNLKLNVCLYQECISNLDCNGGTTCNTQTRRCDQFTCSTNQDCQLGFTCQSGDCRVATTRPRGGCSSNSDCGLIPNTICGSDGRCQLKTCNNDADCQGAIWTCNQQFNICQIGDLPF